MSISLRMTNTCQKCSQHDATMAVDGVWYCTLCADILLERCIKALRFIADGRHPNNTWARNVAITVLKEIE